MRAVTGLLLIALVLVPSPLRADDPGGRPARDREFLDRVNGAIDRGLLRLLEVQRDDGSWSIKAHDDAYPMGPTSLALLTVLNCGYPRKAERVEKAFAYLLERYEEQKGTGLKTYSVALLMMALEEAYADPGSRIGAGDAEDARRGRRVKLPAPEFKWMKELADFLVRARTGPVWRYPSPGSIDHSNTQFALLGLASALRCGVPIPRKVFQEAAEHFLEVQEKDGPRVRRIVHVDQGEGYAGRYATGIWDLARGWGYVPGDLATGSMTTAGVASLAICRSELLDGPGWKGAFGERVERGIHDGLAWLDHHFTVTENPPRGGHHYYYLYGLERAGVLADVVFLGDHDWYREGAEHLVSHQGRDGGWHRGRFDLADSCFALLFLRRATVPVRVPREVTPAPTEEE